MELIRLPQRPPDWDELIRAFDTKTLFHESCWHNHVLTIHPGSRFDYFHIESGGNIVGYFCALRVKKLFITAYGSPLPGTGTNFMGPVVNHSIDQPALIDAVVRCCRRYGVGHLELSHPWLRPELLESQQFQVDHSVTHVCELPPDEPAAWQMLKSTCRNRVRKAQGNGLMVEVTDDPAIAEQYYDQFGEVYAKQQMVRPYGLDRVQSLLQALSPAKRILPIRISHEGKVIATGLFPFDERCIYFWGGASWLADQHLYPNELLHWTVISAAVEKRIPLYNMCGGTSQFKDKFGGQDVPYLLYSRSFIPFLRQARATYRFIHYKKLKIVGRLKGLKAERKPVVQ